MTEFSATDLAKLEQLLGLSDKLLDAPKESFLAVIEQLGPYTAVPQVARLFDKLRPRLRELRPPRSPSLKRLLCRPFEDLLTSAPANQIDLVRIPRSAIGACWEFLNRRAAGEIAGLERRLARLSASEPERVYELGEALWSLAGHLLLDASSQKPKEVPALIGQVLVAAGPVERFKREVPTTPFAILGKAEGACLVEGIMGLRGRGLPIIGLVLAVAARAQSPAALIDLLRHDEADVPPELDAFVVSELAELAAEFEDKIATAGPETLAREAETMLNALEEVRKAIGGALPPGFEQRSFGIEKTVRTAIGTRVIDPAPEAIGIVLEADASPDSLRAAEAHARALRRVTKTAASVGLGDRAEAAISEIRGRFVACIDEELSRPRAAAGLRGVGDAAYRAIRMIELLAGPEAARPHLIAALGKTAAR